MELSINIHVFEGVTAIVTGGASGIGRALSEELSKRNCEVVVVDLKIELAEEVALEIQASSSKAKAVEIDVTDYPAMQHLVEETVKRTGRLDYLFNNAGIVIGGTGLWTHYQHYFHGWTYARTRRCSLYSNQACRGESFRIAAD